MPVGFAGILRQFLVSKNLWIGRGVRLGLPTTSVERFLSHSSENFVRETLRCFRKILVSENFMDKMCERKGVLLNSFGNFLSHSTETLLCF